MLSNQEQSQKSINIKSLSLQEKVSLVQDIWDEISGSQESTPILEDQKKEIDLRLSNYLLKPNDNKSWNLVREEIKSKL